MTLKCAELTHIISVPWTICGFNSVFFPSLLIPLVPAQPNLHVTVHIICIEVLLQMLSRPGFLIQMCYLSWLCKCLKQIIIVPKFKRTMCFPRTLVQWPNRNLFSGYLHPFLEQQNPFFLSAEQVMAYRIPETMWFFLHPTSLTLLHSHQKEKNTPRWPEGTPRSIKALCFGK